VSWRFAAPATEQSVAILMPDATPTAFKVIVYNLDTAPVSASMTGWNVAPGEWEVTSGLDLKNEDQANSAIENRTVHFERSRSVDFKFAPRATTVLTFKLKTAGTPYWQRPDLGIDRDDVSVLGREVMVRIHSLGSVPSPAATLVLRGRDGAILAKEKIPALAAPNDLRPKTIKIEMALPDGATAVGATLELNPGEAFEEITRFNNAVTL
jgi:hypothetical protein